MNEEIVVNDQPATRWFIDLDWLRQNDRSFIDMVQNCLCPKCREQLTAGKRGKSAAEIITKIKGCCSKTPGFITIQLPITESIFRLLLAQGNQPIDLEEMAKQLSERRDGDTYRTSVEILSRLLNNDRYYGLRQVQT